MGGRRALKVNKRENRSRKRKPVQSGVPWPLRSLSRCQPSALLYGDWAGRGVKRGPLRQRAFFTAGGKDTDIVLNDSQKRGEQDPSVSALIESASWSMELSRSGILHALLAYRVVLSTLVGGEGILSCL